MGIAKKMPYCMRAKECGVVAYDGVTIVEI
jgi:hypothetical protein